MLERTGSTSAWLKENPPDAPTLAIAWAQTAGYGQQGRVWRMRPGQDLAFSLFVPWSGMVPPALTPWLAFHLREQLQRWTAAPLWHKWPNDLYVPAGKVSGTLVERVRDGLIIGTGINWWGEPAEGAGLGASAPPWAFLDEWVSWLLEAVPAFTTAATMASASAVFIASGFSQRIILPASAAANTISWCVLLGLPISIKSMSSRSISFRQSVSYEA